MVDVSVLVRSNLHSFLDNVVGLASVGVSKLVQRGALPDSNHVHMHGCTCNYAVSSSFGTYSMRINHLTPFSMTNDPAGDSFR